MNHQHAETLRHANLLKQMRDRYEETDSRYIALDAAIAALSGGGVMVPREATERMLNVGMGLYNDLSGEEGYFVTIKEQRDAFKRVWIAMLAAHAQAGEGSNG